MSANVADDGIHRLRRQRKKTMTKVWVVNYQKPHGQQK